MNFVASIRSAFNNYANFKGRSARPEYWYFFLFSFLIRLALSGSVPSAAIATLGLAIPSISVGVRRMHDVGRSGWWLICPIANLVFLLSPSDLNLNRFGPPPPPVLSK
ncbi:MAG: DUF805 domain-containing protein [Actinomycetota bacterium]